MDRLPELDGIQSFLLVAEELNFRRAAERLNLDQSALSRRIAALESRLGVLLFQRTTREVRLTEAGQAFYESNSQLVDTLRDSISLARRTADGATGRLRIGYMSFAAIVDMPTQVKAFRAAFPNVSLDLRYAPTQIQKVDLSRGLLDVGFMIGPFRHPDFHTAPISTEDLLALLPAKGRQASVTLAELAGTPLVMGTMAQWDFFRHLVDAQFTAAGLTMDVAFEASSTMGLLGLVSAGFGATIFPAPIRRLRPEGIDIVAIADCRAPIQTIVAWRKDSPSATIRNFLGVCGISR